MGRRTVLSLSDDFALFIFPELHTSSGSDKAESYSERTRPSGGETIDEKGTSTQRLIALHRTHLCRCFHTHPARKPRHRLLEEGLWCFIFLRHLPGKVSPSWVSTPAWFYSSYGGTSWITINSRFYAFLDGLSHFLDTNSDVWFYVSTWVG